MPRPVTDEFPTVPPVVWWVSWADAKSETCRGADAGQSPLAANLSCGWIVGNHKDRLVIGNSTSSTGEVDVTTIPKAWIVRKWKVVNES